MTPTSGDYCFNSPSHREQMGKRIEEGIAILVKTDIGSTRQSDGRNSRHSMHVSKIQTLFLPRNFEDPRYGTTTSMMSSSRHIPSASDDHHRAVLHVELQLQSLRPLHSSDFAPSPVTVDVMTTHMRSFIHLLGSIPLNSFLISVYLR